MKLRVLIHGSGFAGQGHAQALQDSGVEVVGMVSRSQNIVERMAAELKIPYAGTDWRPALTDLQPDIVAIGTPGGAHFDPIMAALGQGCHIYCDKPLAAMAAQAKTLFRKAQDSGVKTAYAASYRYQPHALLARKLVADGMIGEPLEVECVSHFNLDPLIPFGWSHRIEAGGGRLNNNFTHKLSIVEHVLAGKVIAVSGEVRNDMPKAPVVAGVHDFRERRKFTPSSVDDPNLEWATADAEWSYTVLAHIQPEYDIDQPVSAVFRHGGLQPRYDHDYITFYGREGAIYIQGHYAQGPLWFSQKRGPWEQIPVPEQITAALPKIKDDTQRNWTQLARAFLADIRAERAEKYQTFKDGWIYQEIIEFVRDNDGWLDCSGFYSEEGVS
jgi:predicted dehydrogenase